MIFRLQVALEYSCSTTNHCLGSPDRSQTHVRTCRPCFGRSISIDSFSSSNKVKKRGSLQGSAWVLSGVLDCRGIVAERLGAFDHGQNQTNVPRRAFSRQVTALVIVFFCPSHRSYVLASWKPAFWRALASRASPFATVPKTACHLQHYVAALRSSSFCRRLSASEPSLP